MLKNFSKSVFSILLALVMVFAVMPMQAFADTTVSVLDGKITVTGTSTTSVSEDVVTATATGGLFSQTTNTITIKNDGDTTATVSFEFTASNYSSFSEGSASGSIEKSLAVGETITMSITGKKTWSSNTATLTLSNFAYEEASATSNVTISFDTAAGSVTAEGASVANGGVATVTDGTLDLVATPVSGYSFYAWVNAKTHAVLSSSATYSTTVANDISVEAIFSNNSDSKAYFYANSEAYLFGDLNEAAQFAASSTNKTIVLMASGTLPAAEYIIPSGVTLLIPFNSAHTLYTTEPGHHEGTENITPTPYRTLKMEKGATISVNGAISLSACHSEAQGGKLGCLNSGPYGCINMEAGSNITVNDGANLYAYGYIIGSGNVVANSGATVYEYFQFRDFRGGSISSDMESEYGVFLFSQYYVQNIEVPLTLYAGASEITYTSLTIASQDFTEDVKFIGSSDSMFTIIEGCVTKRYDGSTDRLIIEADGTFSVSPITFKIGNTITDLAGQSVNIDTADYELPITNNLTIIANSGTVTMNQDLALLPGSEIVIAKDATCVIGQDVNVYAYDADDWGTYCYTGLDNAGNGGGNYKFAALPYVPSRTYTRTEADLVDAKIQIDGVVDASAGYLYTTLGGADIISTESGKVISVEGTQTITYQFVQGSDYTSESNIPISITPAKIKNADGSFLQSKTNTYNYTDGFWRCETHTYTDVVTAPTCMVQGYTTHTCDVCGYVLVDTYTEATGHSYGEWEVVTEPTYQTEGSKKHTCSACGDVETAAIEIISTPDIDGDGDFDAIDLVKLTKIILKVDVLGENVYSTVVDLNCDGKLNILDLIKIKKLSLAN